MPLKMKRINRACTVLGLCLLFAMSLFGQNEWLDQDFNEDGMVTTDFDGGGDIVYDLAVQEDGKIIAVGLSTYNQTEQFAIAGYHPDGELDTSFADHGKLKLSLGGAGHAYSVKIQDDGKIVIAGSGRNGPFNGLEVAILRLTIEGDLDPSFGDKGIVHSDFSNRDDVATSLVIQDDGKILITGYSYGNNENKLIIARYNTDGSSDLSFHSTGSFEYVPNNQNDFSWGFSTVLQKDGKSLVTGTIGRMPNVDIMIIRLNLDGSSDLSFGQGGVVTYDFGFSEDVGYALALDTFERIIVTGYTKENDNFDMAVLRCLQDGQPDSTFGNNGKIKLGISNVLEIAHDVTVSNNGKLMLTGNIGLHSGVVKLNHYGEVDTSFGEDGYVESPISENNEWALCSVLQEDGKLITGGYAAYFTGNDFAIIRYKTEETNQVENISQNNFFSIYPNPSFDKINFNLPSSYFPLKYRIYDVNGRIIDKGRLTSINDCIDVLGLAEGLYQIKL